MKPRSLKIGRRQLFQLWCVTWFLSLVILIQPLGYTLMRAATVLVLIAVWVGGLYFSWRRVPVRIVGIIITLCLSLLLILPGRPTDLAALRADYLQAMRGYEGTRYVWGGENRQGIDCSGLIREGLIQANLQQGIIRFNPALVRQGLAMWWFDLSAKALSDGERGWTTKLFRAESINAIDLSQLLPGDLAATVDGLHILAYLGENKWIEADPGVLRVITVSVPEVANYWFNVPVYALRWRQLG
jgi:NlpC/P60 family